MADLLAIVLPVFGLIGIGYVGRRTGFVSERMGDGLSEFVFSLSVPCLIFNTLVRAEIRRFSPGATGSPISPGSASSGRSPWCWAAASSA